LAAMARAFFSEADANGVSLHSHLAEVIHKLLLEKPSNPLESFESISMDVKGKHFAAKEAGLKDLKSEEATSKYLKQAKKLSKVDTAEEDTGIPNVMEEMACFQWAGVGLLPEESYRLFLAMTALKGDAELGLKSVRFFGKLLGTSAPYFIIEGVLASPPKTAAAADAEPPGQGLNSCVYFVANSLTDTFTQLPDVTPALVIASRGIKKYFTGDLGASVTCFPPFPGSEREYLRAQIARIAAATVLLPSGKLAIDEESEAVPKPLITPEEYTPVEPTEMVSGDNWVHLYGGILAIGRCTNVPKPEPAEGEEEVEENLEEEVPALGAVAGDKPIYESEEAALPAWTFKLCYQQGGSYTVAVATSHRWPGAYSVAMQKADKYANVYFGTGVENAGTTFTPQAPPPISAEPVDAEEVPDVTLAAENELLKAIDEAKIIASNAPPEEEE